MHRRTHICICAPKLISRDTTALQRIIRRIRPMHVSIRQRSTAAGYIECALSLIEKVGYLERICSEADGFFSVLMCFVEAEAIAVEPRPVII